jgi:molybdopterin molybdotransferase
MPSPCCTNHEQAFRFASPAEAVDAITARLSPPGVEHIPLSGSTGRILAAPLLTDRPSPACDVSAMDGFAVRTEDLARHQLPIRGDVLIGREPPIIEPGASLRIVTGAPIPVGADAVIRCEDVAEHAGTIIFAPEVARSTRRFANIRRSGENAAQGALVATAGCAIRPPLAAALSAFGIASVPVYRRPRVAIITTGDEVLPASASPTPWQLRDSNGPALLNLLSSAPWLQPQQPRHAPDDPRLIRDLIEAALQTADALLLTGGVSMGVRDFVPSVLQELGAEILFHKLPQRPGKPILAAISRRGQPILGLPGNPLSVMITARRIAIPAFLHLAGSTRAESPALVHIEEPDGRTLPLWWHRPAILTGPGRVRLCASVGSGDIAGSATSDGFVELPPELAAEGGTSCRFYPWMPAF